MFWIQVLYWSRLFGLRVVLMRTSGISTLFCASLSEKYILSRSMEPYILLDFSASRIGDVLRHSSKWRFRQSRVDHARNLLVAHHTIRMRRQHRLPVHASVRHTLCI